MLKLDKFGWFALILLMIGGLNWGLVGLFNFDLVATIFGDMSRISRIVYALVGLATLYTIFESILTCKIKWNQTHKAHPA